MAEEEDRLDFGEEYDDEEDRESVISLGDGEGAQEVQGIAQAQQQKQQQQQQQQEQEQHHDNAAQQGQPHEAPLEPTQDTGLPLPEGWERRTSRSTGEVYYLNTISRTTSWDLPTTAASAQVERAQDEAPAVIATADAVADANASAAVALLEASDAATDRNDAGRGLPAAGTETERGAEGYENETDERNGHRGTGTDMASQRDMHPAAQVEEISSEVFAAPSAPVSAGPSAWSERLFRLCPFVLNPMFASRLPV